MDERHPHVAREPIAFRPTGVARREQADPGQTFRETGGFQNQLLSDSVSPSEEVAPLQHATPAGQPQLPAEVMRFASLCEALIAYLPTLPSDDVRTLLGLFVESLTQRELCARKGNSPHRARLFNAAAHELEIARMQLQEASFGERAVVHVRIHRLGLGDDDGGSIAAHDGYLSVRGQRASEVRP